jgi:hypothetical protein
LELSCLSSDLLAKVTHWLNAKELCAFDTAILNRQLRSKFLVGVSNDAFLFPGRKIIDQSGERQYMYVRWLLLRRVFLKTMTLYENTNATTVVLYDILNAANPGLETLTLDGKIDFPKDLAVRNAKTLHTLVLKNQGVRDGGEQVRGKQVRGLLKKIREWTEAGGVLKNLSLEACEFGDEVVDVGNCDSLAHFHIQDCTCNRYKAPGISLGCTRLIWDIISKGTNLTRFYFSSVESTTSVSDPDVNVLAKFCPKLEDVLIDQEHEASFTEKAIICLVRNCTKIKSLTLYSNTVLTDATVAAVAANLGSLKAFGVLDLQLQNPRTLRCLAHCCPQLRTFYLCKGNVSETELLYFVKHAKNLQYLHLGDFGHLEFRANGTELTPHLLLYISQDLRMFDAKEPERLHSSQVEWLGRMAVHMQKQPGEMDTAEKLKAASSNPKFEVKLL